MQRFLRHILLLTLLCIASPGFAQEWHDFEIDLNTCGLVTSDEITNQTTVSFGVAVAADGTLSRVAADDASALAVFSGYKYHNDHGFNPGSLTVKTAGNTKITYGCCTYGSDVKVVDAAGSEMSIASTKACYKNSAENVASGTYVGEATTLTITGGSYVRYYKFEKVDAVIKEYTYTFGADEALGMAPTSGKVIEGDKFAIPVNKTLYAEGKTLTGWSDGTTTYAIGEEVTPSADLALTPVFTDNTVSLSDPRETEVAVTWDFQTVNGAPVIGWQGGTTIHPWVAQATIGDQTIDVKMDCDVSAGKMANANWTDWCQMNPGTKLTIPASKSVNISIESYSATTTTTIDGETSYTTSGTTVTYDYAGDAATIDIVIGDGSYFRTVRAVYAPVEAPFVPQTFDDDVTTTWPLGLGVADESTGVQSVEGAFTLAEYSYDDGFVLTTGGSTAADHSIASLTKYQYQGNVYFRVKPTKGLTFNASSLYFNLIRFGTDGGEVNVSYQINDAAPVSVATGLKPRRNGKDLNGDGKGGIFETTQSLAGVTIDNSQILTIILNIDGLGSTKQIGFANVSIAGHVSGLTEEVNKYTLATSVSPADAGTITVKPKSDTYDEGTDVTVTAKKNFGYKFVNWTNVAGDLLSSDATYKFTIGQNTDLVANFAAIPTYELVYGVDAESGANEYMVNPTPAPTVIDGKNMYEDGTTVVLTASSNPIMTFTNWSNGETAAELTFNMTKDRDLVATYAPADFIAGWDFYLSGNNGRIADFAAVDNDADQLVLRDAEGTAYGWLDKSQSSGGYEGRPAGVNWKNDAALGTYYWQTKINASAFKDIKVQTAMVYNYNSYQKYNVEYSLDNENWTLVGTIFMQGAKNWTDLNLSLPAACDNQPAVYVRWIADKTSEIDGTTSNNDGAGFGALYFTGEPKLINPGVPPVLVSTIPAEGADNASANGKIVLTFDTKVQLTEIANATIGSMVLQGSVTGKVATFEYKGLEYSTAYTFTLDANSISDLTDNVIDTPISINFQTKSKPEIAKALYDFVVPDDGNFRDAIAAANARADKSARYRIFIKKGAHIVPTNGTMAGTNEFESNTYPDPRLDLTTSYVSIIGEDMQSTTIKNTCPAAASGSTNPIEGLRHAYTLHNTGTGTYIQDVKLINGMNDATGRGEAYEESGDKTILMNVGLWGYQDTYCSNNGRGRYYFEGGIIRGRTDYICGKDDIFFNGVTFQNCGAGYIAVPSSPKQYGWILRDCKITKEAGTSMTGYTLGRPWGSGTPVALWINTVCEEAPAAAGWNEMSGGYPKRFAEYNSTLTSGTVIDLSGRKTVFGDGHENNPILTMDEAQLYTIDYVLGGDDDWDPTSYTEQASAPINVSIRGNALTWDNSNYALLWAVCKNGKVVDFTTTPSYTVDDANAKWSVRAANEMGGLGEATVATVVTGIQGVANEASDVVSTHYYNMQGVNVGESYDGIVVKVETLSSGKSVVSKMVK